MSTALLVTVLVDPGWVDSVFASMVELELSVDVVLEGVGDESCSLAAVLELRCCACASCTLCGEVLCPCLRGRNSESKGICASGAVVVAARLCVGDACGEVVII